MHVAVGTAKCFAALTIPLLTVSNIWSALFAHCISDAVLPAVPFLLLPTQLPKLMELVGLGYTSWFVYRYLLFKVSLGKGWVGCSRQDIVVKHRLHRWMAFFSLGCTASLEVGSIAAFIMMFIRELESQRDMELSCAAAIWLVLDRG